MSTLFPLGFVEAGAGEEVTPAEQVVQFKPSYKFDFKKGDFVTTQAGKVVRSDGFEAWVQWCFKALLTSRYKYPIYSRYYGQEFEDLIAQGLTRAANESEIERITTETLMRDPRTASVSDFSFSWNGDECYYEFVITNVYDEQEMINQTVVIVT